MKLMEGKTALVTGGSDGIGLGIAGAFAVQGADVVIIGRDKEKLARGKESLEKYGCAIHTVAADLTSQASIEDIAEEIHHKGILINIVVNNAGIARFIPLEKMNESILDYHLALNVKAPYWLIHAFLDDLVESRGAVINISSYFADRMMPDRPSTAYSLTKGALNSFTKALAFELGPKGVRVNAIAPGTVTTPQVELNMERLDDAARERFRSMVQMIYPLRRLGKPEDIADMAVFLASGQAKWITGGIFPVDGGLRTN